MGSVYRDTLQKVWGGRRELRENYSFLKISWTKQHLSYIWPRAVYVNQPSKATAKKSGFLGCSSEIEQCLCGIPIQHASEVPSYVIFSFFFNWDPWGTADISSCHMWVDFLKFWSKKIMWMIYVSNKGLTSQLWFKRALKTFVHWGIKKSRICILVWLWLKN